jgi:hypothetical protein
MAAKKLIEKGTLVKIQNTVLKSAQRSKKLPEATKKVDLLM